MYELAFTKSLENQIKRLFQSKDHKIIKRLEMIVEIIRLRKYLVQSIKTTLQGVFGSYRMPC